MKLAENAPYFDDYNCEFALVITVLMGMVSKDFRLNFWSTYFFHPSSFYLNLCVLMIAPDLRSDVCCMIFDDLPGTLRSRFYSQHLL